jgi:predicted  nucleic acid-binding Zn-ribbon protein
MSRPPTWRVDPAWPAAPPFDDDDLDEIRALEQAFAPPVEITAAQRERQRLAQQVAELHLQTTRLHLKLRRAERELQAQQAQVQQAQAAAPPRNPGGRPHQHARNDRLLAIYETLPAHLSHAQRCRQAAHKLAAQVASLEGPSSKGARPLADSSACQAIAEAKTRAKAR